jgi:outer membrane protein assembly factor BamB
MMRPIFLACLTASLTLVAGADWRQFRGTDSTGQATDTLPQTFDPTKNVAWKVDLPGRGVSSPIVVGGRVFVTASSGLRQDRLHVLAFDATTGKRLWQRSFWATGPTASHPKTAMAAPTPASDGRHVVALFATNDAACFDLDGNLLWVRSLHEENPGATDGRGLASSPLLAGGTVVVQVDSQNTSLAAGIDVATGANRWRIDRPREISWTSPIALPGGLVLLQGSTRLSAIDPATGKEVWGLDRTSDPIASSLLVGKVLLVPGEEGLAALELPAGTPSPTVLWENKRLGPQTASPVELGDRVYVLHGAILVNGDLKTGTLRGQLRLKGPFSASLLAAGGLLYCISEEGVVQVVKPDDKDGQVVGTWEMKEPILATPAIAGGAMYLRSDKHLWKITKPEG